MLLLDTQALVWHWTANTRLGNRARQAIDQALQESELAVSSITFWEAAMLREKGRLRFPENIEYWRQELLDSGLVEIPIDGVIAARAGALAGLPGDPADRIIVATALAGHQLMTSDRRILRWNGNLSTLDARQ